MNQSGALSERSVDRLPVSIITGFLGSGKTTLLNHLVQQAEMGQVAVLINEYGEIGLDHLLVESITDEIVLLQSGCICCQMKGDFVSTLIDLYEKRLAGDIEEFTHVLVETTGIADPAPIVRALLSDRQLVSHYRLGTVIVTLDTVFGESALREHGEAVRQVSLADKLLFCKSDLSDQAIRGSLRAVVRQINPKAPVSEITGGKISPGDVFLNESRIEDRDVNEISNWLGAQNSDAAASTSHSGAISSFSIALDGELEWDEFVEWIDALLSSRSRQILRLKGLLNISGKTGPVVVQAVQNMLYPPIELVEWPGAERRSMIVFISCDLSPRAITTSLYQFFATSRVSTLETSESYA